MDPLCVTFLQYFLFTNVKLRYAAQRYLCLALADMSDMPVIKWEMDMEGKQWIQYEHSSSEITFWADINEQIIPDTHTLPKRFLLVAVVLTLPF